MGLSTKIIRLVALTLTSSIVVFGGSSLGADKDKKGKGNNKPVTKPLIQPTGVKTDCTALTRFIDRAVDARLKDENVSPSPICTDAEFIRRVYLDITGHIPPADKVAAFLDSKDANKRAKLIDELLANPDFGKRLADIWQTLLLPKNSDNRGLSHDPMVKWLEDGFNTGKPWDKMVHELLTVTGSQEQNGSVTFWVANGTVDKVTDEVTKLFLGLQLQCAQCHNHPFTEWKQTEYWEMAAFFMKVQSTPARNAAKSGTSPEVKEVDNVRRGKNALPESAKMLAPKFLGGDKPTVGSGPLRPTVANWIASEKNPYFAKAMVNRLWSQYFGRGIVNPVDDMQPGNAPSHPEMLEEIAHQFAQNNFDVKFVVRAICNSEAYQRSSKPTTANAEAGAYLYPRMAVKSMTPEQLYDSLGSVLGKPEAGRPAGGKGGGKNAPTTPRAQFVNSFGLDDVDPMEYQAGIPQVLNLMNSARMNQAIANSSLVKTSKPQAEAIEQLYLATLSRRPTSVEMTKLTAHVTKADSVQKGYADILWALLNSSEFTLNH
jgi:hypothetical protein